MIFQKRGNEYLYVEYSILAVGIQHSRYLVRIIGFCT